MAPYPLRDSMSRSGRKTRIEYVAGRVALGFMDLVNWAWERATGEREKRLVELQQRRKDAELKRTVSSVVYTKESPTWHERLVDDEDS